MCSVVQLILSVLPAWLLESVDDDVRVVDYDDEEDDGIDKIICRPMYTKVYNILLNTIYLFCWSFFFNSNDAVVNLPNNIFR